MPTLDPVLQNNGLGSLLQAFKATAWPFYCACVPGTPPPINFPPPVFVPPPTWPTSPVFSCSPSDLCATLVAIQKQLNQVATQVGSGLQLTTLLQRYELPFAVIPGAIHSGLSGVGQFAVSRLIGIELDVTSDVSGNVQLPGVPTYVKDLGWMGWSIPSGMLAERRVARQHELWMPLQAAGSTTFGWNLSPGVVVSVRELEAEP